jgi:hypothetical protein
MKSEKVLLDSTRQITYQQGDPTKNITTHVGNFYDNPAHYQLTRSRTLDSKGNTLVSFVKYPQDYIPTGNTTTGNTQLDVMIGRNIVSDPIEKTDSLYYPGASTGAVTGAQLSLYRSSIATGNTVVADRIYKLDIAAPVTNFQPFAVSGNSTSQDSRYGQKISFDQYDAFFNPVQFTPVDLIPQSFIWDYQGRLPIAKVTGATVDQVAYTSFEADGYGGWIPTSGLTDPGGITGNVSYNLSNGSITRTGLNTSATYIVSYWRNTNSSLGITGTIATTQGKTIHNWTYFEHTITGISSITVSGTGDIDELRLYPAHAQMTTYTYKPLVGMTSQCDVGSRCTYYSYDALGRLSYTSDQDGNVVKRYCYNYNGQSSNCQLYPQQSEAIIASNNTTQSVTITFTDVNTNIQYPALTVPAGSSNIQVGSLPAGTYNVILSNSAPNSSQPILWEAGGSSQTYYGPVEFGGATITGSYTINIIREY